VHIRRRRSVTPFSLFAFQDIITSVTGIMLLVVFTLVLNLRKTASSPVPVGGASLEELEAQLDKLAAEASETERLLGTVEKRTTSLANIDLDTLVETLARTKQALIDKENGIAAKSKSLAVAAVRESKAQGIEEQENRDGAALQQRVEELRKRLHKLQSERERLDEQLRERGIANVLNLTVDKSDGKRPIVAVCSKNGFRVYPKVTGEGANDASLKFGTTEELSHWLVREGTGGKYLTVFLKPSGAASFQDLDARLQMMGMERGYEPLAETEEVRFR
jgi:hypothetical protein